MSVSTARPAATVVVARDRPDNDGFDVLMLRRNDKVAFMGGAYVFPGGRVDEGDGRGGDTIDLTASGLAVCGSLAPRRVVVSIGRGARGRGRSGGAHRPAGARPAGALGDA